MSPRGRCVVTSLCHAAEGRAPEPSPCAWLERKRELAWTASSLKEKSRFTQVCFECVGRGPPAAAGPIPSRTSIHSQEPRGRARLSTDPCVRSCRSRLRFAAPSARGWDCKCQKAPAERWFGFRAAVVISAAATSEKHANLSLYYVSDLSKSHCKVLPREHNAAGDKR